MPWAGVRRCAWDAGLGFSSGSGTWGKSSPLWTSVIHPPRSCDEPPPEVPSHWDSLLPWHRDAVRMLVPPQALCVPWVMGGGQRDSSWMEVWGSCDFQVGLEFLQAGKCWAEQFPWWKRQSSFLGGKRGDTLKFQQWTLISQDFGRRCPLEIPGESPHAVASPLAGLTQSQGGSRNFSAHLCRLWMCCSFYKWCKCFLTGTQSAFVRKPTVCGSSERAGVRRGGLPWPSPSGRLLRDVRAVRYRPTHQSPKIMNGYSWDEGIFVRGQGVT